MNKAEEDFNILQATNSDIDSLVDLRIRLLEEVGNINKHNNVSELRNKLYEYFKTNIDNGNFKAWLARINNKVVAASGIISYDVPPHMSNLHGKEAFLMNMYTVSDYRGKGIATKILKTIIEYAKKKNINKIWLRSEKEAESVYGQVGFEKKESYMEYSLLD